MEKLKYGSKEIERILDEVRINSLLFITQNGKIFSSEAEKFIEWINEYSKYCIPEKKEKWQQETRKIIYSPLVPKPEHKDKPETHEIIRYNNFAIIDSLYNFIYAGRIMEIYDKTKSWKEVEEELHEQGHSGMTFAGLIFTLIEYSLIGPEFTDLFDYSRIERDKEFKKVYLKKKKYLEERECLNKRLVYSLSNKLSQKNNQGVL